MTIQDKIKLAQQRLVVTVDGKAGNETWDAILEMLGIEVDSDIHVVKASSFADPADVRAFKRCKATGKTDQECFKVGDNGIGFTGIVCATDKENYCALPREDWMEKYGSAKKAGGAPVVVTYKGKVVDGFLGDTMPRRANIKNGAGIDLNPGFAKAFGLKPPFLVSGVTWRWA